MKYGSVCSGIEAATVAWGPLGWKPAFYSEIDKNPRKVLQHHYPDVPLHGDFTTIEAGQYATIDLLAGGTPCQSYSVAGKRAGLDDPRGELSLEFVSLAKRLQSRWIVWENVPGVLSTNGGRDFATFVGALAECGYGWAYRVLDAQFFGVPQQRRRVVLVGYRGDGRFARAALFERESVRGAFKEGQKSGAEIAGTLTTRIGSSRDNYSAEVEHCVVDAIKGAAIGRHDDAGPRGPSSRGDGKCFTLQKAERHAVSAQGARPRWLTAIECERLQGFPDNYTDVSGVAYWKRHAMLGNSWAVPVFRWLGERIDMVDQASSASM
jgi:DNA (cytosine-5)-methyltransferase 1